MIAKSEGYRRSLLPYGFPAASSGGYSTAAMMNGTHQPDEPHARYQKMVTEKIRRHQFSQAVDNAIALGVLYGTDARQLINHLIASDCVDRETSLDKLARSSLPDVREMAIAQLDTYLGMKQKEKDRFSRRYAGHKRPPTEPLASLLRTWANDFKLNLNESCPCWSESKEKGFLSGAISHTFVKRDARYYPTFQLTIEAALTKRPGIREWFIEELLSRFKLVGEAAKWAQRYDINLERFPQVAAAIARKDFGCIPTLDPNLRFYELKLPMAAIVWIDDEEGLLRAMDSILKHNAYIALDSEWEMSKDVTHPPSMMLIQIATKDSVYLIDTLALEGSLRSRGGEAMMSVLSCPSIVKLAYAFRSDLDLLMRLGRPFKPVLTQISSLVDFLGIVEDPSRVAVPLDGHSRGRTLSDIVFPDGAPCGRGLSGLVNDILGLPLDKSERVSHWRDRPLSEGQIKYAALDAYCLIEIQQILDLRATAAGVSAQEVRAKLAEISAEVERNRISEFSW